jgi:rfaE bifunctional protein nucleotidyltransferase chain/domain
MSKASNLTIWRWHTKAISSNYKIVVTNGCFDILHAGHIELLKNAKSMGDFLVVGLNSDASVRTLKGASRPINSQAQRMAVLEAIRYVDYVHIFNETTATEFLKEIKPDIYVKARDYNYQSMDKEEVKVLIENNTDIRFSKFLPNISTTLIASKL